MSQEFFHHYEIKKYHLLWKSVISQAVIDAVSNCKKTENIVEKRKAISWLSNINQDFRNTCILANYDPIYVYNKVKPTLLNQKIKLS